MGGHAVKTIHLYIPNENLWASWINGEVELDVRPKRTRCFPDFRTARFIRRKLLKERGVFAHVIVL